MCPLANSHLLLADILPHWLIHAYHHNYIDIVINHVQKWMEGDAGYFVMFALLFSCGLGVPLPEDIPLLLGGYFVADGQMNLALTAIAGWCGIMGGDCILYSLGRKFGMGITKVPLIGTHVSVDRINYAHELFEKYGVWVVAVGRLFAGIRGAMVIAAGTLRFNFLHFIIADGFAAIVSGGLFIALGYWGHHKFGDLHHIEHEIERYQRLVLAVLLVVVLSITYWKLRGARIRKAASRRDTLPAQPSPDAV